MHAAPHGMENASTNSLKLSNNVGVFSSMNSPAPAASGNASNTVSGKSEKSVWDPLPASSWDAEAARHLLRRAAWTARPEDVERAVTEGLQPTLNRLFPAQAATFPKPAIIAGIEADEVVSAEKIRAANEIEKRELRKQMRDRFQQGFQDMVIKWLQFAADPSNAATEKWILCLSDVYVVAYEKVRNVSLLYKHQEVLRRFAFGPAPSLTKAVTRSPAMIDYLDLKDSKRDAPNENFARELFELFVLGEGNYTEADIKEAARAFTGYRQRFGDFVFARAQHDTGSKTVFGKSGRFDGDQVVDLAYEQPAARAFLPKELLKFYLSERALPKEQVAELGNWWHGQRYDLRALLHRVFGSELFYRASYRNNYIKSPIQFYLGLVQDLELDVAPLARQVIGVLRQMGQMPFNPPNVRGWVGGRLWINSSTLGARRQLVQALFSPINEAALNADEEIELVAARADGRARFTFVPDRLRNFTSAPPRTAAERLVKTFLPVSAESSYTETLAKFVAGKTPTETSLEKTRTALVTLLESPEYQLC